MTWTTLEVTDGASLTLSFLNSTTYGHIGRGSFQMGRIPDKEGRVMDTFVYVLVDDQYYSKHFESYMAELTSRAQAHWSSGQIDAAIYVKYQNSNDAGARYSKIYRVGFAKETPPWIQDVGQSTGVVPIEIVREPFFRGAAPGGSPNNTVSATGLTLDNAVTGTDENFIDVPTSAWQGDIPPLMTMRISYATGGTRTAVIVAKKSVDVSAANLDKVTTILDTTNHLTTTGTSGASTAPVNTPPGYALYPDQPATAYAMNSITDTDLQYWQGRYEVLWITDASAAFVSGNNTGKVGLRFRQYYSAGSTHAEWKQFYGIYDDDVVTPLGSVFIPFGAERGTWAIGDWNQFYGLGIQWADAKFAGTSGTSPTYATGADSRMYLIPADEPIIALRNAMATRITWDGNTNSAYQDNYNVVSEAYEVYGERVIVQGQMPQITLGKLNRFYFFWLLGSEETNLQYDQAPPSFTTGTFDVDIELVYRWRGMRYSARV